MKRRILIPINEEPKVSKEAEESEESEITVQGILNWISESSYWSFMDDYVYSKAPSLKELFLQTHPNHEDNKIIVGTGTNTSNLKLTVLDEETAEAFIQLILDKGLLPDSNITMVITCDPDHDKPSLFEPSDEPRRMSQSFAQDAGWYRHSCWDKSIFSKSEAWIWGFQRTESEDVLSK